MQKGILLLLVITASATCQQRSIKGCFKWFTYTKKCESCYRRYLTPSGVCGPLLPITDPCLVHTGMAGESGKCNLCRPGYALTNGGECTPHGIFNCVLAVPGFNNEYSCLACGSGQYPDRTTGQCVPFSSGYVKNCLWGYSFRGLIGCRKCAAGYVLSTNSAFCSPVGTNLVGCLLENPDQQTCNVCDAYAGYSMQRNEKCKFIQQ